MWHLEGAQRLVLQAQECFVLRSEEKKEGILIASSKLQTTVREAHIKAQRGEIDRAVTLLLNHGIRVDPDDPAPYQALAELLIDAGRYEDALEVLPEMPPSTDLGLKLELAAVCHCAIGEDTTARQLAQQVPQRSRAQVVLGILAVRGGDLAGAEQLFRQAVDADGGCAGGWLALGMLLWGQGQQLDAWHALQRGLAAEPPQDGALLIVRDMAERLGCQPELSQLLGELVMRWPDSRALARSHALLLARLGPADQALAAFEAFLARFDIDDELLVAGVSLRSCMGLYDHCAAAGTAAISLCMIVKNEEKNLARCLASAKPVVHELVLVDTGSSDRTVELAKLFGVRVLRYVWQDDYAAARNVGLSAAQGAWILVLDADEVLSAHDYRKVVQAASSAEPVAWQVTTRNYVHQSTCQGWQASTGEYPDEEMAEGWYPSIKVRLFRRDPRIRFEGVVHEMVEPALRAAGYTIRTAPFVVHHYGELDTVAMMDKKQHYYRLGQTKLTQAPDDQVLMTELALQAAELGYFEESLGLWDRQLAICGENPEALFNRGGVLLLLKRYREAADASRRAAELQPALKEAWLNLANASLALGDLEVAKTALVRLTALAPDYPPLWGAGLVTSVILGDETGATRYVQRLRDKGYGVAVIVAQRGNELLEAGQHRLAVALFSWLQQEAQ